MILLDPAGRRGEITSLTSLRGVAAVAVLLQHFSSTAQSFCSGWIPSLAPHGYIAVDFFFVLSGFIMAYTYLAGFQRLGMQAYLPFLWKRVARIFPLGIAVTTVVLLAGAVALQWDRPELFLNESAMAAGLATAAMVNLLHVQLFFNEYSLNDVAWSISAELVAYLLFPWLIAALFSRRRSLAVAYAAAGMALLAAIFAWQGGNLGFRVSAALDLARCLAEFGFGMIAYRAYVERWRVCAIGKDRWTFLLLLACLGLGLLRIDLLTSLSFPLLVLAFALNTGAASRALSSRIPYVLGTVSFSIYLVHHMLRRPELTLVRWLHPTPMSPAEAVAFAVLGSLSVLPFAALAYHGIERPGRVVLNDMARRLQGAFRPTLRGPVL